MYLFNEIHHMLFCYSSVFNMYLIDFNLECPAGTFGVNCSTTSPINYFGRLCKIPCNCSDDIYCDPLKGCIPDNNGTDNGKMIATGLTTVNSEVTTAATGITTVVTGVTKG